MVGPLEVFKKFRVHGTGGYLVDGTGGYLVVGCWILVSLQSSLDFGVLSSEFRVGSSTGLRLDFRLTI